MQPDLGRCGYYESALTRPCGVEEVFDERALIPVYVWQGSTSWNNDIPPGMERVVESAIALRCTVYFVPRLDIGLISFLSETASPVPLPERICMTGRREKLIRRALVEFDLLCKQVEESSAVHPSRLGELRLITEGDNHA